MKVERKNAGFRPFKLEIDVETESEARALYAIFSHTNNIELLGVKAADEFTTGIGDRFDSAVGEVIANGVTSREYFK